MKASKSEIVNDLNFCSILADKLVNTAENNLKETTYYLYGYTSLKSDIVRLRRELNEVNKKLGG